LILFLILSVSGNMLCFNVGSQEAFEVSLADVSQSQMQGKTDVVLELHLDDTAAANEVSCLPGCVSIYPCSLVVL
jgi:structure-specific recognition protein 1